MGREAYGRSLANATPASPFHPPSGGGYAAQMLRLLSLLVLLSATTTLAAPSTRPATQAASQDIDGKALPPEQRYPAQEYVRRWRPMTPGQHRGTLLVENLRIHDALNQRAVDIALTSNDQ